MPKSLGIIGCGKMAYALMKGLKDQKSLPFSAVYCNDINTDQMDRFTVEFDAVSVEQEQVWRKADIILLAVKPHQTLDTVVKGAHLLTPSKLVITIAAGVTIESIEAEIPGIPVVRVMPNTPCMVGAGVSALSSGKFVQPEELALAQQIFAVTGMALTVPEQSLDAVTALSGGGPAFIFLVTEALITAGVQVGLSADISRKLTIQTIIGSMHMLNETGDHPAVLREQVCSPGGTTIKGIMALEQNGVTAAFMEAIEQAYQRSISMSQRFTGEKN